LAYLNPRFYRGWEPWREHLLFLGCCLLVALPTVWFPPGSRTRYVMPMYPIFAVLVGIAIERAIDGARVPQWRRDYRVILAGLGIAMIVLGPAVLVLTLVDQFVTPLAALLPGEGADVVWNQSIGFAVMYATAALLLGGVVFFCRHRSDRLAQVASVFAIAIFMGVSYAGLFVNQLVGLDHWIGDAVADVEEAVPPGARLYSFGHVHHLFAYHYGDPITPLCASMAYADDGPADVEYFCFRRSAVSPSELGFPWQRIAAVDCGRRPGGTPGAMVIIGRRTPARPSVASLPDRPSQQRQ
jgi:hypothetical protein